MPIYGIEFYEPRPLPPFIAVPMIIPTVIRIDKRHTQTFAIGLVRYLFQNAIYFERELVDIVSLVPRDQIPLLADYRTRIGPMAFFARGAEPTWET